MKSCDLVAFVTAVACNMANCYTNDELTLLSAIFSQLGDTLATILTNEELIAPAMNSEQDESKTDETKDSKAENDNTNCSNPQDSPTTNWSQDSDNGTK